jgi:hypothetical protein
MIARYRRQVEQAHFQLVRLIENVDEAQVAQVAVFVFAWTGDHKHISRGEFP